MLFGLCSASKVGSLFRDHTGHPDFIMMDKVDALSPLPRNISNNSIKYRSDISLRLLPFTVLINEFAGVRSTSPASWTISGPGLRPAISTPTSARLVHADEVLVGKKSGCVSVTFCISFKRDLRRFFPIKSPFRIASQNQEHRIPCKLSPELLECDF